VPHTRASCVGCSTEFAFLLFVFLKKLFSFLPAISLFLLLAKLDVSLVVFGYSKRLCHVVAIGKVTTICVLPPHRLMPSWGGVAQSESKSCCKLLAGGYCSSFFRRIFVAEMVPLFWQSFV